VRRYFRCDLGSRLREEKGLKVSVRGGGHSVSGSCVVDDGMVVDLGLMRGVWVDPRTQTARVRGEQLVVSLTVRRNCSVWQHVGVEYRPLAGFTLGGGIGWLSRKHGLACDNLVEAQVVTSEGEVLFANKDENKDLFWALRGGGHGLGVVTSFGFRLHRVGPTVYGGMLIYQGDSFHTVVPEAIKLMEKSPDELFLLIVLSTAPPAPFLPREMHGNKMIVIVGEYYG
jgi:FAD/FMN-containing dehydrogenase